MKVSNSSVFCPHTNRQTHQSLNQAGLRAAQAMDNYSGRLVTLYQLLREILSLEFSLL